MTVTTSFICRHRRRRPPPRRRPRPCHDSKAEDQDHHWAPPLHLPPAW